MKSRVFTILFSLIFISCIVPTSNIIAQTEQPNIFKRTVNKFKETYSLYKKCRAGQCSPEEKAKFNQEMRSLAKMAVASAIAMGALLISAKLADSAYRQYLNNAVVEEENRKQQAEAAEKQKLAQEEYQRKADERNRNAALHRGWAGQALKTSRSNPPNKPPMTAEERAEREKKEKELLEEAKKAPVIKSMTFKPVKEEQ